MAFGEKRWEVYGWPVIAYYDNRRKVIVAEASRLLAVSAVSPVLTEEPAAFEVLTESLADGIRYWRADIGNHRLLREAFRFARHTTGCSRPLCGGCDCGLDAYTKAVTDKIAADNQEP